MSAFNPSDHPAEAFRFATPATLLDPGSASPENSPSGFAGVAYSGGVLHHWFWDNVVFDLAQVSFAEKVPVLHLHRMSERAGFGKLEVDTEIKITNGVFLSSPLAKSIADDLRSGFPWQLSVSIQPESIEEFDSGVSVVVNGRALMGPLTVFRKPTISEVSFTPLGVDSNTSAMVATKRLEDNSVSGNNPGNTPDEVKVLTEKLTAAQQQLSEATTRANEATARADAAEAKFSKAMEDQKKERVKHLFSLLKREVTEDAIKPYLAMELSVIDRIIADVEPLQKVGKVEKTAPDFPDTLFSETVVEGKLDDEQRKARVERMSKY